MFAFVPNALIMVINPRSSGKLNLAWESVRAVNTDGLRCFAIFQLPSALQDGATFPQPILGSCPSFPSLCLLDCQSQQCWCCGGGELTWTSHTWALRVTNSSPRLEPFYSVKITPKLALFPVCPVLRKITHLALLF